MDLKVLTPISILTIVELVQKSKSLRYDKAGYEYAC